MKYQLDGSNSELLQILILHVLLAINAIVWLL